jgi:NAD(P)H-dependent FMN reductase
MQLQVVIASTRPGRVGLSIATWAYEYARAHAKFEEVALVDLAEVNLPFIDEPHHPNLRQYTKDHTRAWSTTVAAADAFVFVIPEYNHSAPPALVNAIDYLFHEWHYKPVGLVSYGGVSGGTRSAQMVKQMVTAVKMVPLFESVSIPFFRQHLKDGAFAANDAHEKSAQAMLDELVRWAGALRVLRAPTP